MTPDLKDEVDLSAGLPVAVDAMGGDHGSKVVVKGVVEAVREYGLSVIIVGDEVEINTHLKKLSALKNDKITIAHAPDVITMHDSPARALRKKPGASIRVAFELVKNGKACAVVSPGNTGAMMAAGLFISGTMPGIARPAIATVLPRISQESPMVLLDAGANIDCNAHQLLQFAMMGNFYSAYALSCDKPKIGLLSNGSEPSKGNDNIRAASHSIAENKDLNFVGYIEGRDLASDKVDVIVCDGFVGNVVLKTVEGTVGLVLEAIKSATKKSFRSMIGMALVKPMMTKLFRSQLDPSAYGGAPLLGLNDVAIVCHGHSKCKAIKNAVRVAKRIDVVQLIPNLSQALSALDHDLDDRYEETLWTGSKVLESATPKSSSKK